MIGYSKVSCPMTISSLVHLMFNAAGSCGRCRVQNLGIRSTRGCVSRPTTQSCPIASSLYWTLFSMFVSFKQAYEVSVMAVSNLTVYYLRK